MQIKQLCISQSRDRDQFFLFIDLLHPAHINKAPDIFVHIMGQFQPVFISQFFRKQRKTVIHKAAFQKVFHGADIEPHPDKGIKSIPETEFCPGGNFCKCLIIPGGRFLFSSSMIPGQFLFSGSGCTY